VVAGLVVLGFWLAFFGACGNVENFCGKLRTSVVLRFGCFLVQLKRTALLAVLVKFVVACAAASCCSVVVALRFVLLWLLLLRGPLRLVRFLVLVKFVVACVFVSFMETLEVRWWASGLPVALPPCGSWRLRLPGRASDRRRASG